jgi:ketosteroid isomerase-like protein
LTEIRGQLQILGLIYYSTITRPKDNAMHPNAKLITKFYTAFSKLDAKTMQSCYHPDITFSDPAFPELKGADAGKMWAMLTSRAKEFSIVFDGIEADSKTGKAHWVATYLFTVTGNKVVNDIHASFEFKDGKIIRHTDTFDLWKWSRQALGLKGLLLGWSPLVRNAVQKQAGANLQAYKP